MCVCVCEDCADPYSDVSRSVNLVPYSLVSPQRVQRKRPVLISPNSLARTIIQKILNMGGAMDFNICKPGRVVCVCVCVCVYYYLVISY